MVAASIGLSIGALGPSLPLLHERLHAPLSDLGILFGVNFLGSLVVTLWLGALFDRRSPRPFLVGGVVIAATGLLLLPFAANLLTATAALALAGLGAGTNSVGSAVLTTRLYGGQDGRALSWINMAFGLGAFAGPLIAAAVLSALHDYRPVFAGIAASLAAPALIYARVPLPPPESHATRREHGPLSAWWRPVGLLAVVGFLYLGAEVGFGGWVFTYVRETSQAGTSLASWAPACYWLALSAGSVAAALRPTHMPLERVVLVCGLCSAAVALAFLGVQGAGWQIALATALGLCLGPIYPLTLACTAALLPRLAGSISGMVIASSQVGGTILPWLQGHLLAHGPAWGGGMTVVACATLTVAQVVFIRVRAAMAAS